MRLTVLGSSTPYPRPDHPCSGYLVQHGSTAVWMDAGTGTLAELQRHIALDRLDAIWISHAHADHSADLLTAYYALRFADLRPERPLPLIGPPGLVDRLVGFLGHHSADVLPEVFEITEMRGWGEATIGELELAWGPVSHGMPAFGLRAEVGRAASTAAKTIGNPAVGSSGAVLAYSGDSAYCESLVELADGAQLLLCEAGADGHPVGQGAVHCTPEDAARIAREAGVERLVLTHIKGSLGPAIARTRALGQFAGEVHLAHPNGVFDLG